MTAIFFFCHFVFNNIYLFFMYIHTLLHEVLSVNFKLLKLKIYHRVLSNFSMFKLYVSISPLLINPFDRPPQQICERSSTVQIFNWRDSHKSFLYLARGCRYSCLKMHSTENVWQLFFLTNRYLNFFIIARLGKNSS